MERYVTITIYLIHCMRCIIFLLIFSTEIKAVGLDEDNIRGAVITDPSTTRRCEELIKERSEKITYKNKILSLIDKNKNLKIMTPENKTSIHEILDQTKKVLDEKLRKATQKIQDSGEEIVRIGCPGITL
jgi:hypothetical protein